jgi:hypothetical protein
MKLRSLAAVAGLAVCVSQSHEADASTLHELSSVMVIAKSSNRNQVHYALDVDESCAPVGTSPVHPYWRMLERGPSVTEKLQGSEERLLGVDRQEVWSTGVQFVLRALPARTFVVHTSSGDDGRCSSWVETTIANHHAARLTGVFVQQKLFGMVDYVLLQGTADGVALSERFTP